VKDREYIVVRAPNGVGDTCLATPFYRALRAARPAAHICLQAPEANLGILADSPWFDDYLPLPPRRALRRPAIFRQAAAAVSARRFDTGYLLTNSFSSAALFRLGGVRRRIGYARDARGWLLTDPLPVPAAANGDGVVPIKEYYLNLARATGVPVADTRVELFLGEADRTFADAYYGECGVASDDLVIGMNPGAAYGAVKCWRPDYYARTADHFIHKYGARVALFSSPEEEAIVTEIAGRMDATPLTVVGAGMTLRSLKGLIARCNLFIGNDSGPVQYAIAFGLPVVTVFGPTPIAYAATEYPWVRQLSASVECAPCRHRICPIDHRCMTRVTPEWVIAEAEGLLQEVGGGSHGVGGDLWRPYQYQARG
jgi:heptosyltransferase-2